MSKIVLSAYRTLSDCLPDILCPGMRMVFGSAGPDPGALDLGGGEYALGADSEWNPDVHDLIVSCVLENMAAIGPLYGTGGVAALDAVLLLALEWTSADSGWRCLGQPAPLALEQLPDNDGKMTLRLALPAGSIRGMGVLIVQVFLGSPGSSDSGDAGIARQRGARLGSLSGQIRIVIDGDGSLFPVLDESLGSNDALWHMRSAWTDPRDEPFSSEYVALVLNRDHELFEQLRGRPGGPSRQTPLMQHVVASWIALLVHLVKADLEQDFEELVSQSAPLMEFASIAEAAAGFVRMGELDTNSPPALFASVQRWLDSRVRATATEITE